MSFSKIWELWVQEEDQGKRYAPEVAETHTSFIWLANKLVYKQGMFLTAWDFPWVCMIRHAVKWLNVCIFGLYLKQCVKIWVGYWQAFELTVPVCCAEVKKQSTNTPGLSLAHLCNKLVMGSMYSIVYSGGGEKEWETRAL